MIIIFFYYIRLFLMLSTLLISLCVNHLSFNTKITSIIRNINFKLFHLICNYKYNIYHENKKEIKDIQSTIIMCNHYNANDLLVLNKLNLDYYTIAKNDLFKENKSIPIINYFNKSFFNYFKLISYKRNDKIDGDKVKNQMLSILNDRDNILVFPEGTSTRNGKPKEFKKGIFYLCSQYQIPILPVTIKYNKDIGLNKEDKFNPFILFDLEVDIYIHPIIKGNDMETLKTKVYDKIISKLEY